MVASHLESSVNTVHQLVPSLLRFTTPHITYDRVLKDLDDAYRQVRDVQREVNGFMNDYWRKVAPWFEQLVCLEQGHAHENFSQTDYATQLPPTDMVVHGRELKWAYRRLLKRLHPDTAHTPHPMPATWLKLVQAAYQRGSLYELWRIESQMDALEQIDAKELNEEAQIERLLTRLNAMHAQAQQLRASDEYALWQRAQLAQINGEDWIGDVIEQVQLKIARLHRRQALSRMSALVERYKELLAAKATTTL